MRTEIPVCKRCCFCLPLRYGLIVWGYLRLTISIFLLINLSFAWYAVCHMDEKHHYWFKVGDRIAMGITTFVTIFDIALAVVFIVGCHKKNVKLMKIFYFYSQFLLGLTAALTVFIMCSSAFWLIKYVMVKEDPSLNIWIYEMIDCITFLAHILLQLYMLLLVRSEIIKLNNGCEFRFVNLGAEAQCNLYENNSSQLNETAIERDNKVEHIDDVSIDLEIQRVTGRCD